MQKQLPILGHAESHPRSTGIEFSAATGRDRSSPSPREARTGRGLGRGVSELGKEPSSPRPSPPLVGGEGDAGSSRRSVAMGATRFQYSTTPLLQNSV